ncbi:MarR family winged helix-turn-helix transcriptional regulator [Actinopolymorpha singaporensis]|uniref:MarR family winged helix-turn-helix transcriptional regulator n=1 Tax=Actinopolymorpha singaporensis TaxID=117157 RepID=UPI000B8502FF|nr:MarR family winged helix-turn-helix transcriptional regulator [Actinopolymorpha singaporensis]
MDTPGGTTATVAGAFPGGYPRAESKPPVGGRSRRALLQVLAEHSPARTGDLAARQRLAPSTVSTLVGQLRAAGLITREVDPRDRRASVVTPTDAGRAELASWTQAHERRLDAALGALSETDRTKVRAALPVLFRLVEHLGEAAE